MKLNRTLGQMLSNNSELREKVQKAILAETDQREFVRQGEDVKEKNQDWISKLKQENRQLKDLRDEMVTKKRTMTVVEVTEDRDQNYWKRELDKLKFLAKSKRTMLKGLQDRIHDRDDKDDMDGDNPVVRNIRVMENRLDKIMIQYNEAIAMKDTYEHIVKRLKEERVGYDNQLTAIERSLKGKEHDFEELLLLAHDAAHAREISQAELKKFEHKKTAVRDLREKFLVEKKDDVGKSRVQAYDQGDDKTKVSVAENTKSHDDSILTGEEDTEQELIYYEEALRKLREVSGVNDANEIIQKFRMQSQTNRSMEELSESYKSKIQALKREIADRKHRLNQKTARGSNHNEDRKKLDQMEINVDKISADCDKIKAKSDKANKLLVNARAGIEHLFTSLNFGRSEKQMLLGKMEFGELLEQTRQRLGECYDVVTTHPSFKPRSLEEDSFNQVKEKSQKLTTSKRIDASKQSSDYEFDEELEASSTKKAKGKPEKLNPLTSLLSSGSMRPRRSLKKA